MNDTKCGGLILDAIDQLRKRKARPDFDRISHMLERRHGLKGAAVNEELSRLVSEGIVIKVDYKGNTSYRNAAKWVKTKTQFYGSFYNSSDISSIVLEAVKTLTLPTKDHPHLRSASIQDIEQYLLKRDSQSNLNLATLRAVLEKEVAKRSLHQLPTGDYVPLNSHITENPVPEKPLFESPIKTEESPPTKRIKSDITSQENSSPSNDESHPSRCDYCLFTASANRKGKAEELLVCKDCNAKAHLNCMEYAKLSFENYPSPENWQCPDCKTCVICDETATTDEMLTCNICFKGYHMNCHEPAVLHKPSDIWLCSECDTNKEKERNQRTKFRYSSNFSDEENVESNIIPQHFSEEFYKSLEQYPSSVPMAKKWTIENVEAFFKYIGFEDEAPAFREQEIDGLSLLLMKRNDVITGLGLKLGPAVKIYKHIRNLQAKITDN
ncbi:histone acetyltransferase KAT6B-like isoform X1 [Stegodyphus dumicola]|uniref:histone acetyltransferase KAT6B-like isoform X1 n=1 Tax=Stegodyphus dumicola TaxID=202533 RepID=UPI0015B10EA8|nr:histone acetyltransferase KAT6B-like isoform X1 [Stegodyphus dumicola]